MSADEVRLLERAWRDSGLLEDWWRWARALERTGQEDRPAKLYRVVIRLLLWRKRWRSVLDEEGDYYRDEDDNEPSKSRRYQRICGNFDARVGLLRKRGERLSGALIDLGLWPTWIRAGGEDARTPIGTLASLRWTVENRRKKALELVSEPIGVDHQPASLIEDRITLVPPQARSFIRDLIDQSVIQPALSARPMSAPTARLRSGNEPCSCGHRLGQHIGVSGACMAHFLCPCMTFVPQPPTNPVCICGHSWSGHGNGIAGDGGGHCLVLVESVTPVCCPCPIFDLDEDVHPPPDERMRSASNHLVQGGSHPPGGHR